MGERIDVSVVISTYNGGSVLPCALDSILNQDAPDVAYEVIVVDNNSHDNTRDVIETYAAAQDSRVRYVFEPRLPPGCRRKPQVDARLASQAVRSLVHTREQRAVSRQLRQYQVSGRNGAPAALGHG